MALDGAIHIGDIENERWGRDFLTPEGLND